MSHAIVWVDVPVTDLDRAILFYTAVLGRPVMKQQHGPISLGVFEHGEHDISGCLFVSTDEIRPANGPLVYFNVDGRIDDAQAQIEPCGGKILQPKHAIGQYGQRIVALDSEGNRIALHAT